MTTHALFGAVNSALRTTGLALAATAGLLANTPAALAQSATAPEKPFTASFQGFERNTLGWYDATTPGPLGWCGKVERVTVDSADAVEPAALTGRAYATVASGPCNDLWTSLGVPFSAPYGPGPDLVLAQNRWPRTGYITDLDVYLDPAWSNSFRGNFEFAGVPATTLIQYAATIFEADYVPGEIHTGPHYFVDIEAMPGEEALKIGDYTITEAGWFKFRFRFSDNNGDVQVDFELLQRKQGKRRILNRKQKLTKIEDIVPANLLGPFRVPFTDPIETAGYKTGWVWFLDVAGGLALPIDNHIQRRDFRRWRR